MTPFDAWVDADLGSVADTDARALFAALRGLPAGEWPAAADGGRVEALALANRVAGELRRRIAEAGSAAPAWAAALRPALEARRMAQGHANGVMAGAVRRVGEGFAARGIEAIAFKGFHLAYGVYPEPGDRPFTDVDLLVRPGDLAVAEEVLVGLGFARGHAQTGAGAMEKSFVREIAPGVGLDVDLHWSLVGTLSLMREMRPDGEGMRARSTRFARSGRGASKESAVPGLRFPTPEDALVLATVNIVRWSFRPLGNILDFRELLGRADPAVLVERATGMRTAAALSAALALAAALFGASVPEVIARGLALPRWQRALFRRLLRPALLVRPELRFGATARYALKILAQDGAGGVARTVAGLPGVVVRRVRERREAPGSQPV